MSPIKEKERVRYFMICTGRTGSTLLAAIMGDAGANFGLEVPESWHSGTGDLELRESQRATHHFYQAYRISPEKPVFRLNRVTWDIHRHIAKKHLATALERADCIKCDNLDLAVQPAFQQGYFPRVIINYRRFEAHARSIYQMRGHSSIDWLAGLYNRVYRNGLVLLSLYGGCVVAYNDLVNPEMTSWASALSELTGLPSQVLLERRDARNRGGPDSEDFSVIDNAALEVFMELEKLRGKVLPPSVQALRSWEAAGR